MIKKWIGSPNFDTNRKPIDRVVIHWFGVGKQVGADATFQKSGGTSAHYSIEDNSIHQYVKEEHVAYHAGVYAMNQRSIGIEHSAEPTRPASEDTYKNSGLLVAEICKKYNIPLDRTHIIGHKEVKSTQCPGTMDIDKIINLAKGTVPQPTNMDDKKLADEFRKLTQHNGSWTSADAILKEISLKDTAIGDKDKEITTLRNQLGGKDSVITTAQRERDEALKEVQNRGEQVSRLQEELLKSNNSLEALMRQVKSQQELLDKQGKDVGELNRVNAGLESEIKELKKGSTAPLTVGDVLVLLFKKMFTIKL